MNGVLHGLTDGAGVLLGIQTGSEFARRVQADGLHSLLHMNTFLHNAIFQTAWIAMPFVVPPEVSVG